MKKFLFVAFLFVGSHLMAQSRQGTVEYNKTQVPCYIMDLPYATDVSEDAIKERFKKMGVSSKNNKGFMEFRNVVIPEISSSPVDALVKVDRPSRKDKNASTVYMIVNPIGLTPNAVAGSSVNDFASGANTFLTSLSTNTQDYSLELEIKKQEEEVKKADKKNNSLIDDGNDMQKKLKKLQDDIEDNKKKQAEQVIELQKQRDALTQMVGRRRQ